MRLHGGAAQSIAVIGHGVQIPVNRPKTRDSTTIPVQIQVIAIVIPPVRDGYPGLSKKYREAS